MRRQGLRVAWSILRQAEHGRLRCRKASTLARLDPGNGSTVETFKTPRIAIIGAGPVGLVVLNVLARHNVPATLYERDADITSRATFGGSLDLHVSTGQAALIAAGVGDAYRQVWRPEGALAVMTNQTGESLYQFTPPDGEENPQRPEIDRPVLRRILVDAAPAGSIQWGHAFVSAAPVPGTGEWELSFANGHKTVVDLLIGADGGRSRVRPLVSDTQAVYTGVNGFEVSWKASEHPELAARTGKGTVYAFAQQKCIYAQYCGDGRVRAYTWIATPDENAFHGLSQADAVAKIMAHFGDWAQYLRDFILAGDEGSFVSRTLYQMPVGHAWPHRKGVTIVGDAFHLMTPFAGKGANVGTHGARLLGEAIVSARGKSLEELDAAVAQWEKEFAPIAAVDAEETDGATKGAFYEPESKIWDDIGEAAKERWSKAT